MMFSPDLQMRLQNQYVVRDLDCLDALQDGTKDAPCKLQKKRLLLKNLHANRTNTLLTFHFHFP